MRIIRPIQFMNTKTIFSALTGVLFILICCSLKTEKTKTFKGTIDNHFNLSTTNAIKLEDRQELEKDIDTYLSKIDLLNSYYEKINEGDIQLANKILQTDTLLSKQDDYTLAYMFTLTKLKELDLLYKPSFQVNDNSAESKLIFCNEKQIKELTENRDRIFELNCKYIGNIIIDKTQVYQLEKYKKN